MACGRFAPAGPVRRSYKPTTEETRKGAPVMRLPTLHTKQDLIHQTRTCHFHFRQRETKCADYCVLGARNGYRQPSRKTSPTCKGERWLTGTLLTCFRSMGPARNIWHKAGGKPCRKRGISWMHGTNSARRRNLEAVTK